HHEVAKSAGVQNPRAREFLRVAGAGVLWKVTDLAGPVDAPVRGQGLPRQGLRKGGFPSAIASDEPDLVSVGDPKAHVGDEDARTNANLEVVDGEHDGSFVLRREACRCGTTFQSTVLR